MCACPDGDGYQLAANQTDCIGVYILHVCVYVCVCLCITHNIFSNYAPILHIKSPYYFNYVLVSLIL